MGDYVTVSGEQAEDETGSFGEVLPVNGVLSTRGLELLYNLRHGWRMILSDAREAYQKCDECLYPGSNFLSSVGIYSNRREHDYTGRKTVLKDRWNFSNKWSNYDTLVPDERTVERFEKHSTSREKKRCLFPVEGKERYALRTKRKPVDARTLRAVRRHLIQNSLDPLEHKMMKVKVAKSRIHGRGLFAGQYIEPGHIIIEYTGEKISIAEAEIREKRDKERGKVLSYRFKIDESTVLDANIIEGNDSRRINHSCKPNSRARSILLHGRRRLIFYALSRINKNEEITFNYNFEREADVSSRIKCQCGARTCKGFLN